MKFVDFSLWLFGKPAWEFEEVNPKTIREKGDEIKERLYMVADNLEKLLDKGWEYNLTLYDLNLTKNASKNGAEKELKDLGVDVEVHVWDDEE